MTGVDGATTDGSAPGRAPSPGPLAPEEAEARLAALDDATLLARFTDATLPKALWTHRAHVRVGFLHVRDHGAAGALERLRTGIRRLNAAHGTSEGPTTGYIETITAAFVRLLAAAVAETPELRTSADFCEAHRVLLDRHVLRRHYSTEHLLSPDAKHAFLEPDLEPLPEAPAERD